MEFPWQCDGQRCIGDRLRNWCREKMLRPMVFFYVVGIALADWIILKRWARDTILYPFTVPCIMAAFFFDRRIYLPMMLILATDAFWITHLVSPSWRASVSNILAATASSILAAELIHALVVARERVEKALQESEEKLRTVIETTKDAIVAVNRQGEITIFNAAAETMFNCRRDEAMGRPFDWMLPDERRAQLWAQVLQHLQADTPHCPFGRIVEATARCWGGQTFPAELSLSLGRHGQGLFALAVIRDITERKRMEEALRQSLDELRAHNEELDAFAHTVAHDLKNPLASLLGFGQILEGRWERLEDERRRHLVRLILQSGHRMHNIIDELLLLASVRKMEEVELAPLNMAEVVAEAIERLSYPIEESGAEIVRPQAWPEAWGYAPWVVEVWTNYISNAIKYGGHPPRVVLGAVEQGDGMVRFWVRDNGEGLTPEEQAHLFTPFKRIHQVRAQGHGLGLSIVRRIVRKLGGQVGVESPVPAALREGPDDDGQGCLFYFTLPKEGRIERRRSTEASPMLAVPAQPRA